MALVFIKRQDRRQMRYDIPQIHDAVTNVHLTIIPKWFGLIDGDTGRESRSFVVTARRG